MLWNFITNKTTRDPLGRKKFKFDENLVLNWRNLNLTQIFGSKLLNFFALSPREKMSHFDLKKIEPLAELKFDPNF